MGNKPKGNKESKLQKLILDWLFVNRYYAWRNYVGAVIRLEGAFSPNPAKGMPDIMGLLKDGRLFAIEVKVGTTALSLAQKQRIADLNAHGGLAFVARDLEDVIRNLKD